MQQVQAQVPEAKLRLIGPVDASEGGAGNQYLQKLQTQAADLPVEWVAPIYDPHKLAAEFRGARVFCYPSVAEKGESCPLAPLEAMACGLVTVVSGLEAFEEYVVDGQTGYIFNHRRDRAADWLAESLLRAIAPSEENDAVASRAAARAKEFNYGAIARRYLSEFEKIL